MTPKKKKIILQATIQFQKCPVCQKMLELEKVEGEELCKTCGYVYNTSYPYVAGVKINYNNPYRIIRKIKRVD